MPPTKCQAVVDQIHQPSTKLILASSAGGFISLQAEVEFEDDSIVIDSAVAKHLEVEAGSTCVILPLRP